MDLTSKKCACFPSLKERRIDVAIVITLAGLLGGCSSFESYKAARAATENFHRMMDGGDYAAIYDQSTGPIKKSLTRDQGIGFFKRVNRKLGSCEASVISFGNFVVSTSGTTVTTNSLRTCQNGKLQESFTWLFVGEKPILYLYRANSPLLLTD